MKIFNDLKKHYTKISLIGLGYVGLPIAIEFAKKLDVIGFDLNEEKIKLYQSAKDPTGEVGDEVIKNTTMEFTSDANRLQEAKFHIIAVPTPVNPDHTPDLTPLKCASRILGQNLIKGSIVVYESTVYPGATEEVCVPILEKESGLICGEDFKVGYSPERINPADSVHRIDNIIKIVSGMDAESLDEIAKVYELIVKPGVHRAESIKVAEAAKVIENSQRDINIAFVNELSIIFHRMGIDTKEVLAAAGTKWNFLPFAPGLVGGHCIGVDPYYLTHKAAMVGYHSQVITAGRSINDDMGRFIAENVVKAIAQTNKSIRDTKVFVIGFAFKENCQDTRNTKVIDIVRELKEYGMVVSVIDDVADKDEAKYLYDIDITELNSAESCDVAIVCVQHDIFKGLTKEWFDQHILGERKMLFDIKGMYDKKTYEEAGYYYWRL